MNPRMTRTLLGIGIPGAVTIGGFWPYLMYRTELPERLATHFDTSGTPDGSMSLAQLVIFTGAMMAIGFAPCVAVAISRRPLPIFANAALPFVGGFVAALGATILATTILSQRGLASWQQASLSPLFLVPIIGSGLVVGGLAAWLGSQLDSSDPGPAEVGPTISLAAGERAVWTGSLSVRWPVLLGVPLVLGAIASLALGMPIITIVLALSAVPVVALSRIRVSADDQGLRVRYGPLGWPRTVIPSGRIESATVIDVDPMRWGGWGYRGSLKLMRRAAVVLRSGPGIRLDLADGRVFVVTVDDPTTAVAVINAGIGQNAG